MEERQSRLSNMDWKRFRPYLCVRLIPQNSMFSNFCHLLKSAIQKISVTLLSVIVIQYLLFATSKLLNISDIAKRTGSLKKLPVQLFYGVPYPELALIS